MLEGIGIIVGGWVVGSVVAPDIFRFAHSSRAVAATVLLSRVPAILTYNLAGVVIAKAYESSDLIGVMRASVGLGAVVVVVAGEFAINAMNLYMTGLAMVTFFDTALGVQIPRRVVTLVCAVVGSTLGAAGILSHLIKFLSALSVTFPPIAGIILCDYYLIQRFSKGLSSSKQAGRLPQEAPTWVPGTLAVWLASCLIGLFVTSGMPSMDSFLGAAILYALAGAVGALRAVGVAHVDQGDSSAV